MTSYPHLSYADPCLGTSEVNSSAYMTNKVSDGTKLYFLV